MKKNKITNKKTAKKRRGPLAWLGRIADAIVRVVNRGPIGFFFADLYTKCNEKWKNGFVYNLFRRRKQKMRERATLAHIYEDSLLSNKISTFSTEVVHSNLRIWGVALLFFAFAVIAIAMVKYYFFGEFVFGSFIIGALIALLSFPLIISKKELGEALLKGRLTKYVITRVLNLNTTRFEKSETTFEGSYFVAILFATSVGCLTYFIDPMVVISIALLVMLFTLLMSFPELGPVFTMIALPFANVFSNPSIAILVLVGFSFCGFMVKLLRAKRVMRLELIDVLVCAFTGLMLFGGVFSHGGISSLGSAAMYCGFILIYFLIGNMYISKSSIHRSFKILIVTATIVSIVGIIRGGAINESWVDLSMFGDLPGRVSVFLGNPNMLGAYLVIIFPLTLGQMKVSQKKIIKLIYFIAAALIFACTVLTGSRGAWIGIIVTLVLFLLIYNFRNIWIVLLGAALVPVWNYFLPNYIVNRFSSIFTMADTSVQMRLNIWSGAWNMAKSNWLTGIGVGERAFRLAYSDYAVAGAESAVHSHSLPLQILLELGIVGLVVFALIMFTFWQKSAVEIKNGTKKSKSRTMIAAGMASIGGAMVMGLTDNIWYNYRVFMMFWIVVALTVTLSKNNVRERELMRVTNNMTSADIEFNR